MNQKLVAAATLAALCAVARAGEHRFTGETIQDGGTGFAVVGEKKDGIVSVTSARHHYSLLLPWATDWTFTEDDSALLKGTSGMVTLTLSEEESEATPERHLRTLQSRLSGSGRLKGVEKSEIVTFKREPILRILVDAEGASGRPEFRGMKLLHLHSAKRFGKLVYVLHLALVIPADEAKGYDDKLLRSLATVGFRADYLRDSAR
jgi:hypothetical protein